MKMMVINRMKNIKKPSMAMKIKSSRKKSMRNWRIS